jgi:hypothetical protein
MRTTTLLAAIVAVVALILPQTTFAQNAGECSGGVCGTPKQSGGGGCGCGCGGGSILVANTDDGDTYQYADDYDDDGIEDDSDNCPFVVNKSQVDTDGDGYGDGCDVCPNAGDKLQLDTDGDGIGDACDDDKDNDGLLNPADNCPLISNLEQVDTDNDAQGDACDADDDNDKVDDVADNCPLVYNPMQESPEQLGNPKCDTDADQDNITDSRDNCPQVANADQKDLDGDKVGDLCDTDMDNDTVLNVKDNCPLLQNEDQADMDRDGKGDACDSRFCYVVNGDEKNCLDPQGTFRVYSPLSRARTGEPVRMRLFANRMNVPIQYKWIVQRRPGGSSATVENSHGTVRTSTPYEYHYIKGNVATFAADEPGEYTIKLVANLVFPDPVNPSFPQAASYLVTVVAEGESMGGCSMGSGSAGAAGAAGLVLLSLLGLVIRRRR